MLSASTTPPRPASEIRPRALSVCMIVRNEEAILARCLASVKDCADQVIVVDTGSTDGTVDIARSCGATVISSPWQNDFSQARNVSIDAARCAWILWLDADDVVPPASAAAIARLKAEPADRVLVFRVRNEKPGGTGSDFKQARMFPNRPDLRFERRIHEQISLSALRAGVTLADSDVLIEHHGYADPSTVQAKARRNIDMLLKEYDPAHPDPVMAVELADAYDLAGDRAGAQSWYQAALAVHDVVRVLPDVASHAHLGLGKVLNDAGDFSAASAHLQHALEICPDRPDALYSLAVALEKLGRLDEAIDRLRAILAAGEKPLFVSVDYREARIKAYLRLERLCCRTGRTAEAESLALEAAQKLPARPEMQSMLGRAHYRSGKLLDALHAFEKSLQIASAGNVDAFIGLCLVYVKADRAANARETLEQLRAQGAAGARYLAARRLILGERAVRTEGTDPSSVDEEEGYLRVVFGVQ